jgi:hypothetical protein
MKEGQNRAILITLIQSLRSRGSWCGETHIQKAAFFLKKLTGVPIDFDFILYKHGPFSFEMRDEINVMHAFDLIDLESQYPYGPRLVDTERGKALCGRFPKTTGKYKKQIDFIADKLGDKGVVDLERLATAYFVTLENPEKNQPERSNAIVILKPHIKPESARQAVEDVDVLIAEVEREELRAVS